MSIPLLATDLKTPLFENTGKASEASRCGLLFCFSIEIYFVERGIQKLENKIFLKRATTRCSATKQKPLFIYITYPGKTRSESPPLFS